VEPDEDEDELPEFEMRTTERLRAEEILNGLEEEKIRKRLKSMNSDKASGADDVSVHVLKMCADEVSRPLKLLFKKSLKDGEIPEKWKEANVKPIFKKGSRFLAANYRPVSLTSVVCRLLEGIIRDKFMDFLVDNKLITMSCMGLRKKHALLIFWKPSITLPVC
jgi:hypothetical protein